MVDSPLTFDKCHYGKAENLMYINAKSPHSETHILLITPKRPFYIYPVVLYVSKEHNFRPGLGFRILRFCTIFIFYSLCVYP